MHSKVKIITYILPFPFHLSNLTKHKRKCITTEYFTDTPFLAVVEDVPNFPSPHPV